MKAGGPIEGHQLPGGRGRMSHSTLPAVERQPLVLEYVGLAKPTGVSRRLSTALLRQQNGRSAGPSCLEVCLRLSGLF